MLTISRQLPSTSPEFWTLTHKSSPDTSRGTGWSNVEPFIHITKLDIIQSRIHRTVFRVDKDVIAGAPEDRAKLDGKMVKIRESLDDWARAIPRPPKDADNITWMYDPESSYYDSRDFFNLCVVSLLSLSPLPRAPTHAENPGNITKRFSPSSPSSFPQFTARILASSPVRARPPASAPRTNASTTKRRSRTQWSRCILVSWPA